MICTTRKSLTDVNRELVFLDAFDAANSTIDFSDVDIIINLIACSKFADCLQHPNEAKKINVDFPLFVANKASKTNSRLIQFSTSAVLPCVSPQQAANNIGPPRSVYGKQKREAEDRLLALGFEIFRISKVLLPFDILGGMRERLRKGQNVNVFSDLFLCPLSLGCVLEAVLLIINYGRSKLYQLSSDKDLSYEDVLRIIADHHGFDQKLINPMSCDGSVNSDHILRYTSLEVSDLFKEHFKASLNHKTLIRQIYD